MWLLVSVVLAGIALWLWKKPTPGVPTGALAEAPAAVLKPEIPAGGYVLETGFPGKLEQGHYMSTSGAVVVSSLPRLSDMVPGVLYVEPMAPTLEPGVYKPVYHYIDPVTGHEYAGVTPPIIS